MSSVMRKINPNAELSRLPFRSGILGEWVLAQSSPCERCMDFHRRSATDVDICLTIKLEGRISQADTS